MYLHLNRVLMLNWIVWNKTFFILNCIVWNININCIKMNLALNNLRRLICHKTQTTNQSSAPLTWYSTGLSLWELGVMCSQKLSLNQHQIVWHGTRVPFADLGSSRSQIPVSRAALPPPGARCSSPIILRKMNSGITSSDHPRNQDVNRLFGFHYNWYILWNQKRTTVVLWVKNLMLYTHNHNDINNNSSYTYAKTQADSVVSVRTHLLVSDFSSSRRWERQILQC